MSPFAVGKVRLMLSRAAFPPVRLQVILPEGAHNVVALPPFEGVSEARTERFTFLDTTGSGRPVVILKMKNVVKEHNVMLKVGGAD